MGNKRNKNSRKKRAKIIRSKERIKRTSEVFTPRPLVNEILSKLPTESFTELSKTFMDPACGNGAFLTQVVIKKITEGTPPTIALQTTFGVDLMIDNVKECKQKLLDICGDIPHHRDIVNNNIKCGDALGDIMKTFKPFFDNTVAATIVDPDTHEITQFNLDGSVYTGVVGYYDSVALEFAA